MFCMYFAYGKVVKPRALLIYPTNIEVTLFTKLPFRKMGNLFVCLQSQLCFVFISLLALKAFILSKPMDILVERSQKEMNHLTVSADISNNH